jgi:hypothetical protein
LLLGEYDYLKNFILKNFILKNCQKKKKKKKKETNIVVPNGDSSE